MPFSYIRIILLVLCLTLISGCMKHKYYIEPDDTFSLYESKEIVEPEDSYNISFNGENISLTCENSSLSEIVEKIVKHYNLSIAHAGVLRGSITVNIFDLDKKEVLKTILKTLNYELNDTEGMLTIKPDGEESSTTREISLKNLNAKTLWQSLKEAFESDLKVVSVPGHNALIISGDTEKVNQLDLTIASLDKPSPSILLEIVLLEVNKSKLEEFGISLADLASKKLSVKEYTADGRLGDTLSGFEIKDDNGLGELPASFIFKMNVKALNQAGMVKIVTHPHVVCRSGEKANVEISLDNYVYMKKQNEDEMQFYFDIEKISAGVKLEIMPTITNSGLILISFSAEESNVTNPAADTAFTVDRNTLNSTLIARDGEVLVAGGMVQKTYLKEDQSVPFLEKIPLINLLFKNRKMQKDEREIVFFIMPKKFNHKYKQYIEKVGGDRNH